MKIEIISSLDSLQKELEAYLVHWRKFGGGTKGHAIGSMIKRVNELTKFFKNDC